MGRPRERLERCALGVAIVAIVGCGEPARPLAPPPPLGIAISPPTTRVVAGALSPDERALLERSLGVDSDQHGRVAYLLAPKRGEIRDVRSVDYASLPLLAEHPASLTGAVVAFESRVTSSGVCPEPLVPRRKLTWKISSPSHVLRLLRIGQTTMPRMDGDFEDVDRSIDAALDGPDLHATWIDLDEASRTADAVDVTVYEGRFVADDQRALAREARSARARALVPGTVYAYRRCLSGCGGATKDAAPRVEELQIVGPPASWVGSSSDVAIHPQPSAPFSAVAARLERGSSATLFLAAVPSAVSGFRGALAPATADEGVTTSTYSVDVVWPESGDPELTVSRGAFLGDIVEPTYSSPADGDCDEPPGSLPPLRVPPPSTIEPAFRPQESGD